MLAERRKCLHSAVSDEVQPSTQMDAMTLLDSPFDAYGDTGIREDVVKSIMHRVGVALEPEKFVYEVARAYAAVAPTRGTARLESRHADAAFEQMIVSCAPVASVLVLGCGDGLCGFDTSYARRAFLEIWPATPRVVECAVTQPMLWDEDQWPDEQFEAVICYSIVHYIYNLQRFFKMVRRSVRPGGFFVMSGHNARFWQQPELRAAADTARARLRSRARWKKYLSVSAWYRRARRLAVPERRPDVGSRVNGILVPRLRMSGDLTTAEISHLIDVHRPSHDASPLQIGFPGLDVTYLSQKYLNGFTLKACRTHGWSGFVAYDQLSPGLRARDAQLGQSYPNDGAFFSACWQRSV